MAQFSLCGNVEIPREHQPRVFPQTLRPILWAKKRVRKAMKMRKLDCEICWKWTKDLIR